MIKKILHAIPEDIFYDISTDEAEAFLDLFNRRKYSTDSLEPGTKETRAYFAAKTGDGKAARTFITLSDESSFKREAIVEIKH